MKCQEDGCQHDAQFVPKICIPATGYPEDESRAIQMILEVKLCRHHCEEFKPEQVLDVPNKIGSTLREALPVIARLYGSQVAPDGDRAWIVPVRIGSASHLRFIEMLERGRGDGV